MIVQIVEEDIHTLSREIESCKEAGLNQLFFKFFKHEKFLSLSIENATNLLIALQSLMKPDVIYLSVDISQFINHGEA